LKKVKESNVVVQNEIKRVLSDMKGLKTSVDEIGAFLKTVVNENIESMREYLRNPSAGLNFAKPMIVSRPPTSQPNSREGSARRI
jgi:lipoate synthase